MASISGAAAPPSSGSACRLRLRRQLLMRPSHLRLRAPHSIADLSRSSSSFGSPHAPAPPLASKQQPAATAVEKDPIKLWDRYVEWLYQHKELGLFVDVSRMGFTDDFLHRMEPLLQRAFVAMGELKKGAIANPDEGRMVGHYWLHDPGLAPNSFLRTKIEKIVDHILAFSQDIVSGKSEPVDKRKIQELKSKGSNAVGRKDFLSAAEFYSMAMELDPDNATLFSNRSLCWLELGKPLLGLLDALECRKRRPDWPKALYRQSKALMSLKDYMGACEAFLDALKLDLGNAEVEDGLRNALLSLKVSRRSKAD